MLKRFNINPYAIWVPLIMLSAMWGGFFLQHIGQIQGCFGAIIPLYPDGLAGVFFSPFLHGDLQHLFSNSVPMAVLLFLLFQFYRKIAPLLFIWSWWGSGFLVWLLPPLDVLSGEIRPTCIIGASGMVYVLAFFLFFSGVLRKDKTLMTVSLLVALYYGGMIWGMIPEELFHPFMGPSKISWQSHLAGGVLGVVLAFGYRKTGNKKERFIWEYPHYYNEKDDKLWQEYLKNHPEDTQLHEDFKPKENIWKRLDDLE